MKKESLIKTLGIVATVGGMAATLLSGWVANKQLDCKINDLISEKLEELAKLKES